MIFMIFLFANCDNTKQKQNIEQKTSNQIKYSSLFDINKFENYKKISIFDPWNKDKVLKTYYLVPNYISDLKNIPNDGIIVRTPVKNVIALSSTQIGILNSLKQINSIKAVAEKKLIYNQQIRDLIDEGKIKIVHESMSLDFEKVINMKPDVVFATGWNTVDSKFLRLEEAGIPTAYIYEWQENSPLARAEWLKFIAAFFDDDKKADSIFNEIDKNYKQLLELTKSIAEKPSVLHGSMIKDTWFVPGGKSYVANLYNQAAANYIWKDNDDKASLSLSFEVVLSKAANADFWIFSTYAKNKQEFENSNERYKLFAAFINNKLYSNIKRLNIDGANDYWESGIVKPDIILKDVIKILHPKVLKEHQLFYFEHFN